MHHDARSEHAHHHVADEPVSPAEYAARVTIHEELVHVTVETHRCAGQHRHLRAA